MLFRLIDDESIALGDDLSRRLDILASIKLASPDISSEPGSSLLPLAKSDSRVDDERPVLGDRDGTPHFRVSNRCLVRTLARMMVFLRTRRKRAPARDTEINTMLRKVATSLATASLPREC